MTQLLAAAVALATPAGARSQELDSTAAVQPDSAAVQLDSVAVAPPPAVEAIDAAWPDSILLRSELSPEGRAELERQLAAGPVVFQGATEILRDSVVPPAVLVVGGDLAFAGRTPGSVLVVGGDLYLRPGADIGGDAIVVDGGFYGSALARVAGERRVVRGGEVAVLREGGAVEVVRRSEPKPFPIGLQGIYGFVPEMYNRIDGLSVRWGLRYVPPRQRRDTPRLSAHAILRTSRDDIGWVAAAEKEWWPHRFLIRGSWYNRIYTPDRWHRTDAETSLSTLFLGEDNRFYFDRQGVELLLRKELHGPLAADVAFRNDKYRSVFPQDPFTIASDDFLPNPTIPTATMRSVLAGLTWDSRDDPEYTVGGWLGRIEGEAAGGLFDGDYSFTTGRLEIRRYQPLGKHRLDARLLLAGRVGGTVPEQRRFHLGGAATLAGFEALSVQGDRAALLNLRYRIPVSLLQGFPIFKEGAWIALLADGGDAWESGDDPDWLGSAGVGVGGRGPLSEVGLYVVAPSERVTADQNDVSVFVYFGSFF